MSRDGSRPAETILRRPRKTRNMGAGWFCFFVASLEGDMSMQEKQDQASLKCQEPALGDLFPFYLNGDVTPEERRKIEEHLSQCDECQEELEFFLALQRDRKARVVGAG